MRKKFLLVLALWLSLLISAIPAIGHHHAPEKPQKSGILLVAFGTTFPEAQVSFEVIEKKTREAFPDTEIRWAFTSQVIRKKMAEEGEKLDSVAQALSNMAEEGFTHVAVQSLHTIAGEEFHKLHQTVSAFRHMPGGIEKILVGLPLMGEQKDMARVESAILSTLPEQRKPEEAVIFMGHGSDHASNASYPALMWRLQQQDPNIFMGVVKPFPEISDILPVLKERKVEKVWLLPFMAVAGDHARNDMAGPDEDSWKSILENAGMECEVILRGTGEYTEFVEIWVDHIREIMERF